MLNTIPASRPMPIHSIENIDGGKLGLWCIDGTEEETYDRLFGVSEEKVHPRTSLQRKASRLLLHEMLGFLPELGKHENGKPFLHNSPLNVSISHTDGYAAVMLGERDVAVDVQAVNPRIMKLRERYLKPEEMLMAPDMETATLLWAAKETVYKYRSTEKHDFKAPIGIHQILGESMSASVTFASQTIRLRLGYRWLNRAALVWLEEIFRPAHR